VSRDGAAAVAASALAAPCGKNGRSSWVATVDRAVPGQATTDEECQSEREVGGTLKDSPNFSLTLTTPLTWAGSTPAGAGCPRPRRLAHAGGARPVFPPNVVGRSTAPTRRERASLPNRHRALERLIGGPRRGR
jgi:hypothetical protein